MLQGVSGFYRVATSPRNLHLKFSKLISPSIRIHTLYIHTHMCISAALQTSSKTLAGSPSTEMLTVGVGVPALAASLQGARWCGECVAHTNSLNSRGSPESQNALTGVTILISQLGNRGPERRTHCPESYDQLNGGGEDWTPVWLTFNQGGEVVLPPPPPPRAALGDTSGACLLHSSHYHASGSRGQPQVHLHFP